MNEGRNEKIDPESLTLRAPPRRVTRLNRRILFVAAGVLCGLVLLALFWALRPPQARKVTAPERAPISRVPRAEGLATLPADYSQVPKLGPPLGELGRPLRQIEQEVHAPHVPERATFTHDPEEDAARAARLSAQAEAEAAAKAPVFFKLNERRAFPAPSPPEFPDANTPLPHMTGTLPPLTPGQSDDANGQSRKRAFIQRSATEHQERSSVAESSQPLYVLKAGDTISAALITRINSDLPGTVTAMVTENIFDSDTGRHLLIPQGSTLIGRYDSEVSHGQSRVLLVWTQLARENRPTITLDPLVATDASGQSGLHDRVDRHWKRIFAGAVLSTLIGVAAELASPDRESDADGRIIVAARDSLHETTNEVGQQLTQRSLDVQPTLSIREGYPLRVMISADLTLPAYDSRRGHE